MSTSGFGYKNEGPLWIPVIQEEPTGCGIAASAALAGISYVDSKLLANSLGIQASDKSLWSETTSVRRLLAALNISLSPDETAFESWEQLPKKALLAIKWRLINDKPFWHWVVFVRQDKTGIVLDSKRSLKNNVRTDLGRMKPKMVYRSLLIRRENICNRQLDKQP